MPTTHIIHFNGLNCEIDRHEVSAEDEYEFQVLLKQALIAMITENVIEPGDSIAIQEEDNA